VARSIIDPGICWQRQNFWETINIDPIPWDLLELCQLRKRQISLASLTNSIQHPHILGKKKKTAREINKVGVCGNPPATPSP
jgi:hypothetical protein